MAAWERDGLEVYVDVVSVGAGRESGVGARPEGQRGEEVGRAARRPSRPVEGTGERLLKPYITADEARGVHICDVVGDGLVACGRAPESGREGLAA